MKSVSPASLIPSLEILKCPVTTLSFDEQVFLILKWARLRASKIVCLANVHMIMEAYWSQKFSSILKQADLVISDGMPLVWTLKLMGVLSQQRVAGMDLFLRLCHVASLCDMGIFFVGSHAEVLARIRARLKQEYPNLKIAGMEPLPFRPLTQSEDRALVHKINQSSAGVVLVCLGCPKQEYWMAQHAGKIKAVMIAVGAVFPLYAGIQRRAPRIMRESGLEWAYRLIQEPLRLWPRYSRTIPPFLYLVTRQLISQLRTQYLLTSSIKSKPILGNHFVQDLLFSLTKLDMVPAKIGEILIRSEVVDEQVISFALDKQKSKRTKLGEILIEEKLVSKPELDYFLNNQKTTLSRLLLERKLISREKIQKIAYIIDIDDENTLEKYLIQNEVISSELSFVLKIEKYLRVKGFWLNSMPELELNFNSSIELAKNQY